MELINIEELKQAPRILLDRGRTDEKREKDRQHLNRREQIAIVFKEAYRDNILSLGEVDVDNAHDYPKLKISAGDVLRDPKLRFSHPFLNSPNLEESKPPLSRRDRLREFGDAQGWEQPQHNGYWTR